VSAEYGLGRGVAVLDGMLQDSLAGRAEPPVDVSKARALPGRHNHQNARRPMRPAGRWGWSRATSSPRSRLSRACRIRLETIGTIEGVRFVNDSKATNAQAAEQAIRAFPNAWWIVGGRPKEEGIDDLAPLFGQIRKAYLIGESTEAFARDADRQAGSREVPDAGRGGRAGVRRCARFGGEANPVVLFSPACASFDQFKDFEQRGNAVPPGGGQSWSSGARRPNRPERHAGLPQVRQVAPRRMVAHRRQGADRSGLILLGAGMVLSLAAGPAAASRIGYDDPFHFVYRQVVFASWRPAGVLVGVSTAERDVGAAGVRHAVRDLLLHDGGAADVRPRGQGRDALDPLSGARRSSRPRSSSRR
jgi:hypothetical protein